MPTLGEIKTEGNLKILLFGNSGAGKTCFAAGFPYPMLYLDFDGKVDSAALFYKSDTERLANIEVRNLAKGMKLEGKGAKADRDPMTELGKIIAEELIPQTREGTLQYKTIVLDSITTFSSLALEHILATNPGIKRPSSKQGEQPSQQDYGILKREFARLIPGLLSLPCNIVMLGHIDVQKDETTGEIIRGPLMDGSFAKQLPIYFKEVWRAHVNSKGEYTAQTKADSRYDCRSQIPGIPKDLSLNYEALAKYL